jgi:hypothetical protein
MGKHKNQLDVIFEIEYNSGDRGETDMEQEGNPPQLDQRLQSTGNMEQT